jgi:integrase/recombinase XerD
VAPKRKDDFADVHGVRGYVENRLAMLASDQPIGKERLPLGRAERTAILEFVRVRRGVVGELRIRTFLSWLPVVASRLGDGFLVPVRTTPTAFREAFKDYARSTKETIATCVGAFWRWKFEQAGEDPPTWLRIRLEAWKPTNDASDMLSRDEIARIAEGALNFRDRAWIWTLFNSGCRPGEIYRLQVGDVVPHDEGYIELRVRREKGSAPEPAPVYEDAVPALLAWLNAHPRRKDPAAPLWVNLGGHGAGTIATYRAMYKAIESAARRAKVDKPVTPYAFRRSRLTLLAKDPAISSSILEKVAGWVPGSRVAQHYIHLSGKDVISALNARYGVKSTGDNDNQPAPRTPLKCGRCKTLNPAGAAYCMTCGGPLSLPAVKQIEEARSAEERLAALLRQPEAVEFLAQLLANRKSESGRGATKADAGEMSTASAEPASLSETLFVGSPRQRVVSLIDAERLIMSGYEFVASLGAERAILRIPSPIRARPEAFNARS